MKNKKNDRRISRTRHALREAFQELVNEKGFDQLTVEEITDRANLGRTTFYLHYKDKEDLLLENFTDLIDNVVEQVSKTPLTAWKATDHSSELKSPPVRPALMLFQHASQNVELYRIVMRGEGVFQTTERLREIITRTVKDFARSKMENEGFELDLQVPLEVLGNYYAGALVGMITWWLENDMPYTPQQMAQMFSRLFLPGLVQALGLEPG